MAPMTFQELIALWHKARRSLTKLRQQLLNEAEALLGELPEDLRGPARHQRGVRAAQRPRP